MQLPSIWGALTACTMLGPVKTQANRGEGAPPLKGRGLGVTPEELNYVSHRRLRVSEMRKGRKGAAKEVGEEP